MVRVDYLLADG